MKYDNTSLPENVRAFLEEIIDDEELCDAFYSRDVEIYDEGDYAKDNVKTIIFGYGKTGI